MLILGRTNPLRLALKHNELNEIELTLFSQND